MGDGTAGEIAASGGAELLPPAIPRAGQPALAPDGPPALAPHGIAAWLRLAHPPELVLGLFPAAVALAALWATGVHILPLPAILTLLALVLAQAGAHMLNEYVEFERGRALASAALWHPDALADHPLSLAATHPLLALRVAIALLALGACAGIPLIETGGVPVAILGVLGLAAAVLYSSTNVALKRLPGGELIVPLALGPGIAVATTLAQRQRPSSAVLLPSVALGALALAYLLASTLRTRDEDARLGRRSLAVVLPEPAAKLLVGIAVLAAYVLTLLVSLPPGALRGVAAVILSLPTAIFAVTGVVRAQGAIARAATVGQTLRLYVVFASWLLLGLLAAGTIAYLLPHL